MEYKISLDYSHHKACVVVVPVSGRYLLGLLQSGEVFVWHKDKDAVKIIPGLSKQTKNYQAGLWQ